MYTKNILETPLVKYYDINHMYIRDDEVLTSCTTFIDKFTFTFDSDHWSAYSTLKEMIPEDTFKRVSKDYSFCSPLLVEELKSRVILSEYKEKRRKLVREWKISNRDSRYVGSKYHLEHEKLADILGFQTNIITGAVAEVNSRVNRDDCDNYSISNNLIDIKDGYYSEMLLWNDRFGLAGLADRVFVETVDNIRYVDIYDYKTNEKLDDSFMQYMLFPVNNLPHSKMNLYMLQLSLYGWMLEQFGFVVRNLAIQHYSEIHKLEYAKAEIESMLLHTPYECTICHH
ncbi:MAG: hypothetical protein P8P29_04310 [Flavobacteriaceae bacterium]|nr:hypothetical protein [Flavobacteriaceae bacterium]